MSTGTKIGAVSAIGLAIIVFLGITAYLSTQQLLEANRLVIHAHEVIEDLDHILLALDDAETSQRGFVLTGEERYLEPYHAAAGQVQHDIDVLADLTHDNPAQQENLHQVQKDAAARLAELEDTIELRKELGLQAALEIILTDWGKKVMDDLRGKVAAMKAREQKLLDERNDEANKSAKRTLWTIVGWVPLGLLVLAVAAVILLRTVRFGGPAALPGVPRMKWGGIAIRYAAAVIFVAVAVILRMKLQDAFGTLPVFITLYPALLLAASIGGGGPGITATILAALAADYWFLKPYGTLAIEAPNDVLALGIFTGAGLFLSVLAERLRRSRWAEAISVAQEQQLEEMSRLNEELSQQSEELSQQSEELSQRGEELARQNEELQTQAEEIQTLNAELVHREEMLQKLLNAARLSSAEQAVIRDICGATKEMFGPAASAVMVLEQQGNRLAVRGQAGLGPERAKVESLPVSSCFVQLAMEENKTAALADASLRPDLSLIGPPGEQPFQAVLAAPMRRRGTAIRRRGHLQPPEAGVDGRAVPASRVAGRPVCPHPGNTAAARGSAPSSRRAANDLQLRAGNDLVQGYEE